MVKALGPPIGGHRQATRVGAAAGADVVGGLAVNALHLRLRLRSLEIRKVRGARLRDAQARSGHVVVAAVGAHGEGLLGQARPEVLSEVELTSRALERQHGGGLHAIDAAEGLGDVVHELLLGREAGAGGGEQESEDGKS